MSHGASLWVKIPNVSIWYGLDRVPHNLEGAAVTIGVFDGVHRGHQELINRAVAKAKELGVPAVMFTFDPHPTVVFQPESVPKLLGTVEERAQLAMELGIDHVVVQAFTPEIASWSPEEYIDRALLDTLRAKHVVVGENFTFGHKASGTPDTLREVSQNRDFTVDVVPLFSEDNHTVCSTWIRQRIAEGDMTAAAEALGRPFSVEGVVTHGAGRGGRALGFPTANLYFPDIYALPSDGVYAGYLEILPNQAELSHQGLSDKVGTMPVGAKLPAAISVGTNPTFGHEPRSVESFVLDHEADLYDFEVRVSFVSRIRGQEKYDSLDELIAAIDRDVAATRKAVLG